jgi:hypothetical protein
MKKWMSGTCLTAVPLGAVLLLAVPAHAASYTLDGGTLEINGVFSAGDSIRTGPADSSLLPLSDGKVVGLTPNGISGHNGDSGDLNYGVGDSVSEALNGFLAAKYTHGNYGLVAEMQGWADLAQSQNNVAFGNAPNGFTKDSPLSDAGLTSLAKFQGVALGQLYLFGKNEIGNTQIQWKAGQQTIELGPKFLADSGLDDVMPHNLPATVRAGSIAQTTHIPVPAISADISITPTTTVSGWLEFEYRPNVANGCGTFYAQSGYIQPGCNYVFLTTTTESAQLAAGYYVNKQYTKYPNDLEGGLSIQQAIPSINALVGLYYAEYGARNAYAGVIKSQRTAGPLFVAYNPGQLNPGYFIDYPASLDIFGLTAQKNWNHGGVLGEITYVPNQPFDYNGPDEIAAFTSKTAPTPLRAQATALAPGGIFNGYQRLQEVKGNFQVNQALPGLPGAQATILSAEVAYRYVPNLPDVSVARFGRPATFGAAAVNGVCTTAAGENASDIGVQCAEEGFDTRTSVGYRLRAALKYNDVVPGVDLTPAILFGADVKGYSEDQTISQGRRFALLSLTALVDKRYTFKAQWLPIWGGTYNATRDLSSASFSLSYSF